MREKSFIFDSKVLADIQQESINKLKQVGTLYADMVE